MSLGTFTRTAGGFMSGTSKTIAHIVPSGDNLLLVYLGFGQSTSQTGVTVTYNSVSMTKAGTEITGYWDSYIFYLVNPPTGASYDIYISWTTSASGAVQIATVGGADTSSPIRDYDGVDGMGTNEVSLDSASTDKVFSGVAGLTSCYTYSPLTEYAEQNNGSTYASQADGSGAVETVVAKWSDDWGSRYGFAAVTVKAAGGVTVYSNQPNDTDAVDCYINQYQPTTAFNGTILWCGYPVVEGNHTACRILIKDPFTGIPPNISIVTARLKLTVIDDDSNNSRTARAYRLLRNWTESATWNTYDGSNSWGTAGASNTTSDINSTELGTFTQPADPSGSYNLDLLGSVVEAWISGSYSNYGLVLKVDTESNDGVGYASSAYSTTTFRPKWIIEYTLVLAGGEPVAVSPYMIY